MTMTELPPSSPLVARIVNGISRGAFVEIEDRFRSVTAGIPGWSTIWHYLFFVRALEQLPDGARVCTCGVYHGCDLALISDAAKLLRKEIRLTGVDLFSTAPCADWPEEKKGMTWKEAFGVEPPDIEAARRNAHGARIIQADSISFLRANREAFDFVYLDTSHDYLTVIKEITSARMALDKQGACLLAGDDYHQPGTTWGVDRAVSEWLPHHVVLFDRIWLSGL